MKIMTKFLAILMALITVFGVSTVAFAENEAPIIEAKFDKNQSGAWGNYEENHVEKIYLGIYSNYVFFTQLGSSDIVVNMLQEIEDDKDDKDDSWLALDSFSVDDPRLSVTPAVNEKDSFRVYLDLNYTFEPDTVYSFEICAGALKSDDGYENDTLYIDLTGKQIVRMIPHEIPLKEQLLEWLDENHPDWTFAIWLVENFDIFVSIYAFIKSIFPG